jgi:ribose 5-phosphate isomerase B
MKKLITESEILRQYKEGKKSVLITKDIVLTPLALDKIKSLGLEILSEQKDLPVREKCSSFVDANCRIAVVGCDHTGFDMKKNVSQLLNDLHFKVVDVGTYNESSCDYPDIAQAVAKKIKNGEALFGVIIDATGIPSAITANKFKGIRAATCYNEFTAKSSREHNNSNIIVLGAKALGEESIKSILIAFINTKYEGGRHQRRLDKITEIENINFKHT